MVVLLNYLEKIDSWKNILSKNQVSKIENKFGDVMNELGYL